MPSREKIIKSHLTGALDSFLDDVKQGKIKESGKDEGDTEFLNIIEFIDRFKLLPDGLYPVQKFIVKMYYKIPLDDTLPADKDRIKVTDKFGKKVLHELTEKQYLEFLYNQGRCNVKEQDDKPRGELILILGRRSGKCSDLSTKIFTDSGILSFDELLAKHSVDRNSTGWTDVTLGISQERGKKAVTDGLYYGGVQDVLKVKTYCGYEIKATPEHRLKILDSSGSIVWKYLRDLKIGDHVGVNRSCDLWTKDRFNCLDLHQDLGHQTHFHRVLKFFDACSDLTRKRKEILNQFSDYPAISIKIAIKKLILSGFIERLSPGVYHRTVKRLNDDIPVEIDTKLGLFLGILTGDGTWNTKFGKVEVTGGCEEFRPHVEELFLHYFGRFRLKRAWKRTTTCEIAPWHIRTSNIRFRDLLDKIGYERNVTKSTKRVPWVIFRSPKEVVASYLRGLFETDGGMESGSIISFCSHSEQLCKDVQLLLLNFGIVSRFKSKYNKKFDSINYVLNILGGDSRKIFADQIGFVTNRKQDILIKSLSTCTHGCSDTESIPHLKSDLRALRDSIPKSRNNELGTRNRPRSDFKEIAGGVLKPEVKENPSYGRLRRLTDFAFNAVGASELGSKFQNILDCNYFWDPITEISESTAEVADLSVPDGNEYVANGFTNHNSSISAIFAAYEIYKLLRRGHPQSYYGSPSGSEIRILCVANDKEQASIVYGEMQGHVDSIDYFKSAKVNDTQTYVRFRTENDRKKYGDVGKGTILATFKSSIAKGLRGRGCICAILDEIAFFVDDGKCSNIHTPVLTDQGIKTFDQILTENDADRSNTGWTNIDIGIVQESGRLARASRVYYGGIQKTRIVITKSKYSIESTPEHRLKVISSDGNIEWKYIRDFQIGDHIGINNIYDDLNIIPNQDHRLKKILESVSSMKVDFEIKNDVSYKLARELIQLGKEVGADPEAIEELERVCDANYFWDPVVSVSESECEVADLFVPDGNEYVAAGMTNHNSSAERVYKAIHPSLAQFSPKDPKNKRRAVGHTHGRMVLISSPDAREGFFYRQYQLSMSASKASEDMLMIQAPTWEVNPTLSESYYEIEYSKDPRSFMTEHGAEFSDRVRGWIEEYKILEPCIIPELRPQERGLPREAHFAGFDLGLGRIAGDGDGSSIALTHFRNGRIQLAYHEIWYAGKSWQESNPHLTTPIVPYALTLHERTRLDISEIVNWIQVLSTKFYILKGVFDQWSGIVLEQELHKKNLTQFEMRNFMGASSSNAYQTFKMLMYSKQIGLYDYPIPLNVGDDPTASVRHSPLIAELLELQATSGGKNIIDVSAPKVVGKHDDQSDALARSILLATEHMKEYPGSLEQGNSLGTYKTVQQPGYGQFHRSRNRLHGPPDRSRTVSRSTRRF